MKSIIGSTLLLFISTLTAVSQDVTRNTFGKGINLLAADSSFSVKMSVRIQSLYQGTLDTGTDEWEDGFQIRRARLKFDGFAYSERFQYKIELALANSDINSGSIPESGNTSNIILDAYAKWNFAGNWTLWFGQAKLPGNRERVISSQALQFVDRSLVNARYNLDRDAGIQLHYNSSFFNLSGALSMGEGRNIIESNAGGYGYTARVEYLPFGKFKNKGDYFSSDLEREQKPKLSIGVSYDFNDGATRERGQLGDFIGVERDLSTWMADAHFKYQGFSSLIEYANRTSPNPLIYDEGGELTDRFYTGEGITVQAGYLLPNNLEFAGRYTSITPESITLRNDQTQYTFGVSRYFVGHSLKVQTDISLTQVENQDDEVMYRLQLEVGL